MRRINRRKTRKNATRCVPLFDDYPKNDSSFCCSSSSIIYPTRKSASLWIVPKARSNLYIIGRSLPCVTNFRVLSKQKQLLSIHSKVNWFMTQQPTELQNLLDAMTEAILNEEQDLE